MVFEAKFTYTNSIVRNLGIIELSRGIVELLPLPPDKAFYLKHIARYKSTRNSTAIEGNTLTDRETIKAVVRPDTSSADMQQEVRNYWEALDWLEKQVEEKRRITEDFIKELHCIIEVRGAGRRGTKSTYRTMECPVVDSRTHDIDYAPAEPKDIPELMNDLISWLHSKNTAELPVPIRAGLLAHRFVSIHPFSDGNGRTTRALATAELWLGGYDMRGFLSLEEFYSKNRQKYYASLQMGLPWNFYDGRNNPDHTEWLEYFISMMARAADELQKEAVKMNIPRGRIELVWEELKRLQQQLLSQLLLQQLDNPNASMDFTPGDICEWYGVSVNTAREWLKEWREENFVEATREGTRIRQYRLATKWHKLVLDVANSARNSTSI